MKNKEGRRAEKILNLERCCRNLGLPVTVQRRVILESLAGRTDHPTADQIYEEVRERLPGISRTTVYRVLDTLFRLGVVQKIASIEAKIRFDADTSRHHHLYCQCCGRIDDIHDARLRALPLPDCGGNGFHLTGYAMNYTGICADCRAASATKPSQVKETP